MVKWTCAVKEHIKKIYDKYRSLRYFSCKICGTMHNIDIDNPEEIEELEKFINNKNNINNNDKNEISN